MFDWLQKALFFYDYASSLIIFGLISASLVLCFKLKFIHITGLPRAFSVLFRKSNSSEKKMSSFAALSAVIGGNLGVGNITGVAVALATGGPGAIVWMCLMIGFVSILKYANCVIGVYCRKANSNIKIEDAYLGGPMYCLDLAASRNAGSKSMFFKVMAHMYVIALVLGSITIGNFIQINSVSVSFASLGISKIFVGILFALVFYMVINGGISYFAKVCSKLVPFMAVVYMLVCIIILAKHYQYLPGVLSLICKSAFKFEAVSGATVWAALNVGALKSILATDSGLGLESILHSHVTKDGYGNFEVNQGLISVLSPIFVMVCLLITTLTFMVTGVWTNMDLNSTPMSVEAFNVGLGSQLVGPYFISIILFFFAFTTALTWEFCAEKALIYVTKNSSYIWYWKLAFVLLIPMGSLLDVKFVWLLADIVIPLMLLPNIVTIVYFLRDIVSLTNKRGVR